VGHRAVLHGCTVEDDALIGMGAIVLNGAVIGAGAVIAAGALVPEGATIAPGALVVGLPARRVREVTPEEQARFRAGVAHYVARAAEYKKKNKD
jgi:carbonic anhydrase/acetyltransferase-like protein (isoleucine patch superfamily)